jgi:hypothetical protein
MPLSRTIWLTIEQLKALPIFEQFLEDAATEAKKLGLDVDGELPKGDSN